MYVLDVAALKDELSGRETSPSDSLKYLLGFAFLCLPESLPYLAAHSGLSLVYSIVSAIVFILGVVYCYAKNGGKNGPSFVQRFVALSWVVSVRFLLVISAFGLLAFLTWRVVMDREFSFRAVQTHPVLFVLAVSLEVFFFYRLGVHVDGLAGAKLQKAA